MDIRGNWMQLVLMNFDLVMFILAIIFILIHRLIVRNISESEIVYRWMALFALGFTGIYTFILHAFFPELSASLIGWRNNPFQFEVAIADLAIGILGILSFRASYGFRLATVIASTIWLWGDAVGHVMQIIRVNNFSIGNAGTWFWLDIILPIILIICITNLRPGKLMVV